jgi:ankyrin repeat protein
MHSSSSTSSTDPEHYLRHLTAAARHAAGEAVANEEEQASSVRGSPPRMLELRENAGLIEDGGMEVDDAQDNSASRGQKRKRDLPGDMPGRHSPPKFRRVDRDDGQTSSSSCEVAVREGAACSPLIFDAEGSVTGRAANGEVAAGEGAASSSASLTGSATAIGTLVWNGGRLDQFDSEGNAPLHLAARFGDTETVRSLLALGAQVDQVNGDDNTPLHLAAFNGHAEIANLLIQAGAGIHQPDSDGDMPLHLAALKGDAEAVDVLIKAGAGIHQPDGDGDMPLHLAALRGHAKVVDVLIKAGATVNQADSDGDMPLHLATVKGHAEVVDLLLEAGAQVDPPDHQGNSPLHLAIFKGHAEVVDLLLKDGAQVNQLGGKGNMPLHRAARYGDAETVRLLLAHGAKTDVVNDDGYTPPHLATIYGHANVVRVLLPARTEIRFRNIAEGPPGTYKNVISAASLFDDDLLTALEIAIREEYVPMVELSLADGVLPLPNNGFPAISPTAFPIALPTPLPFPIHDLLLCGPATAPASPVVAPDMLDTLVSIFEACSTAQMTPKEIDDALREAGLLSPVVDELAGQFWQAPQLKQAMAGDLPLTRAQIRQALAGMLGELEHCMENWPRPYRAPERRTALAPGETGVGTPVPWLSEEGQAHLVRSLEKQVQALAEMGRQRKSDELGEGVSDLLALCLAHMPVADADSAAALRHLLTAKLGMYGSLADKTVQAWQATLATRAHGAVADASMLGQFAYQLQAHLSGAATYSRVRSSGAIDEAAAQIMTQLMLRQWTMLEQYWKGAAAQAVQ